MIHGDSTRSPLLGSETSRESSSLQPSRESSTLQPSRESSTLQPSRESSTLQPSRESSTLQTIRESSTLQPSRESSTPQTSRESSTQQANRESSAFLTSLDLSMASFAAREARRSPGRKPFLNKEIDTSIEHLRKSLQNLGLFGENQRTQILKGKRLFRILTSLFLSTRFF